MLRAVIDSVLSEERVPSSESLLNHLLSLRPCHAAVRAGDRPTPEEIAERLAQHALAQTLPHHCPHGWTTRALLQPPRSGASVPARWLANPIASAPAYLPG